MTDWPKRIGELAGAVGVTVRTLHHYDQIGLLRPSRSEARQRLYDETDLRRLYRILALRRLGFGLPEIAACLDQPGFDPRSIVRRQLDDLRRRLRLELELETRLTAVCEELDRTHEPSADQLIDVLEALHRMESYYTPEQRETMEAHRQALGEAGLARGQQEWTALIAEVEAARRRGVDPADPQARELGRRWMALVEGMTGGDAGVRQSMLTMFEKEGPEAASGGAVSPELWDYIRRAIAAGKAR